MSRLRVIGTFARVLVARGLYTDDVIIGTTVAVNSLKATAGTALIENSPCPVFKPTKQGDAYEWILGHRMRHIPRLPPESGKRGKKHLRRIK